MMGYLILSLSWAQFRIILGQLSIEMPEVARYIIFFL